MSEAAQTLLTQVLALPLEEQQWLSGQLQEQRELPLEEEIEGYAEWREELDRRLQSIADGTAVLIDADVAIADIRTKLAMRRAS